MTRQTTMLAGTGGGLYTQTETGDWLRVAGQGPPLVLAGGTRRPVEMEGRVEITVPGGDDAGRISLGGFAAVLTVGRSS